MLLTVMRFNDMSAFTLLHLRRVIISTVSLHS